MRAKKLLLCLIVGLQCGMRQELEAKQASTQEVKPMEAVFAQYLLDNEEEIRQYNLEPRKILVEIKRILSCLELIGNALHIQRWGYSDPNPNSKPKTLRQDLDKDPSEFLTRNCFDLELRIPKHSAKDGIIEDIIQKLEAKNLVPTDMTKAEFMRRIRNIKMRLYDKTYKDDILPKELQYDTECAIQYLQNQFFLLVHTLKALMKELKLTEITVNPSFTAYETLVYAEEYFKDCPATLEFLDKHRTQILMLVTSGKMPKLEEKIQPNPNPLIHELDGFLGMDLGRQLRDSASKSVVKINVPLTLDHLTKQQVAELGRKRDALQSMALVQELPRDDLRKICEHNIAFIDAHPDRAYFDGKNMAEPNIDLDEKLDWIAEELRNPHFSDESAQEFQKVAKDIASKLLTQNLKSMLEIKLVEVGPFPRLDQAQSKAVLAKISEDYTVSRALKEIKKELPHINTRYKESDSGTLKENDGILQLILCFLARSGFYYMEEIDPAKFRTFLETTNHDLFTGAFECICKHWTAVESIE